MHKLLLLLWCVVFLGLPMESMSADKKDRFLIRSSDNIRLILEQEIDLPVKLQMRSGTIISGTVVRLGVGVVQIADLGGGMDLYDAVVKIDDISAVMFKSRKLKWPK